MSDTVEALDDRQEPQDLLQSAKRRLMASGALDIGHTGPLGRRLCKIGRTRVGDERAVRWARAVRRLSRRPMYQEVERFDALIIPVSGETARLLERALLDFVRREWSHWRFMNERGGSAGSTATGLHAVYLAVYRESDAWVPGDRWTVSPWTLSTSAAASR